MEQPTLPEHVVFSSYGNDSFALLLALAEKGLEGVTVIYSDTGWAHPHWHKRVEAGEKLCESLGFTPVTIGSEGLYQLSKKRKGWPRQGMQFCTRELKVRPALDWLEFHDPDKEAVCVVGVRRAESRARSTWPEWTEDSEKHGGRMLWAPLVRMSNEERDQVLRDAGVEPLPTRSMECWPCVNSNRADIRTLSTERVDEIARMEEEMGYTSKGKPRTFFRPYRHGGAVGIREVKKWADSGHGKYQPPSGGCDSGFCGG